MKKILIFTILFAALTITSDAFAYSGYRYVASHSGSHSGIYSRKTTAAHRYNPVSYGNYRNGANHYENRRIANILAIKKYEAQLAKYEAGKAARNFKQREQRLAQMTKQQMVRRPVRNIKTSPTAVANNFSLNQTRKSSHANPTLNNRVIDSSDFDEISASIERDIDARNHNKAVAAAQESAEQPSFFQRLKWALFGRS